MGDDTKDSGTDFEELEAAAVESGLGAVIEAVKTLDQGEEFEIAPPDLGGAIPFLVISKGKRVVDLKPYFDAHKLRPDRKRGTANLTDLESFIAHANRFKDASSVVYLDDTKESDPKLISVLDYHEAGAGQPRFGDHRGVYAFPVSDAWKAWTGQDGLDLSQAAFASFLEDRIADVLAPGAVGPETQKYATSVGIQFAAQARLLELSKTISIKVDTQVAQSINPSTGEATLLFKEEHASEGGGAVKVPNGFCVLVPVFRNGAHYQIPVRLRYRVAGGRVLWKYALNNVDKILLNATDEAKARVQTETGLPVFRGRPEG